ARSHPVAARGTERPVPHEGVMGRNVPAQHQDHSLVERGGDATARRWQRRRRGPRICCRIVDVVLAGALGSARQAVRARWWSGGGGDPGWGGGGEGGAARGGGGGGRRGGRPP